MDVTSTKICGLCGNSAPYRCPTCQIRYCSVVCCKKHKETPCQPPQSTQEVTNSTPSYNYPTEDTVDVEKLKLLGQSEELKNVLKDSHLRLMLKTINAESNPGDLFKSYMDDKGFSDFVDVVLKIIEPPISEKPDEASEVIESICNAIS